MVVTETSIEGDDAVRSAWVRDSVAAVRSLADAGVDVRGWTWWPVFDFVDWSYASGGRNVEEFAVAPDVVAERTASGRKTPYLRRMGLVRLEEQPDGTLARVPTAAAEAYRTRRGSGRGDAGQRGVVAAKATAKRVLRRAFVPPCRFRVLDRRAPARTPRGSGGGGGGSESDSGACSAPRIRCRHVAFRGARPSGPCTHAVIGGRGVVAAARGGARGGGSESDIEACSAPRIRCRHVASAVLDRRHPAHRPAQRSDLSWQACPVDESDEPWLQRLRDGVVPSARWLFVTLGALTAAGALLLWAEALHLEWVADFWERTQRIGVVVLVPPALRGRRTGRRAGRVVVRPSRPPCPGTDPSVAGADGRASTCR